MVEKMSVAISKPQSLVSLYSWCSRYMRILEVFFCFGRAGPDKGKKLFPSSLTISSQAAVAHGIRVFMLFMSVHFIKWNLRLTWLQIYAVALWRFSQALVPSIPFCPSLHFWIPTSSSCVLLILIPALLQYRSKAVCHCSDPSSHFLALLISLTLLSLAQLSGSLPPYFQRPLWLDLNQHVSKELLNPLEIWMFYALRNFVPSSSSQTEVGGNTKSILGVCALVTVDSPMCNQKQTYLCLFLSHFFQIELSALIGSNSGMGNAFCLLIGWLLSCKYLVVVWCTRLESCL